MGYIELGFSLGLSIGPLCASVFFYLGGYPLSFYVFGSIMLLSIMSLTFIDINESNDEEEETPNFISLIFDKVI